MSSSPDLHLQGRPSAPRVGILRGLTTSTQPVHTQVRPPLPPAIRDLAAQEARQREAVEAGFAEGYAAGLARADEELARQNQAFTDGCRTALRALDDAGLQLRDRNAEGLVELADQVAALALRIAEIILQREVAAATDPGRDAIARAIHLVPAEGEITVHLHPEDQRRVGDVDDLTPGRGIRLIADPGVDSGGCVIMVGATRIDAQIPAALARIDEVLR